MSSSDDSRAYYEEEARRELRRPLRGRRLEERATFVQLLGNENRRSVVDFGAGPGFDAVGFTEAGISYVGVDLAHGNGVLAQQRNVIVVHGSITHPPLRSGAFDAGWSMSTIMHLPTEEVPAAIRAMADCIRPGGPLVVGLWGGVLGDQMGENELGGHNRLFSLRSLDANCRLLAIAGDIEHAEIWDAGPTGWEYHFIRLRIEPK